MRQYLPRNGARRDASMLLVWCHHRSQAAEPSGPRVASIRSWLPLDSCKPTTGCRRRDQRLVVGQVRCVTPGKFQRGAREVQLSQCDTPASSLFAAPVLHTHGVRVCCSGMVGACVCLGACVGYADVNMMMNGSSERTVRTHLMYRSAARVTLTLYLLLCTHSRRSRTSASERAGLA